MIFRAYSYLCTPESFLAVLKELYGKWGTEFKSAHMQNKLFWGFGSHPTHYTISPAPSISSERLHFTAFFDFPSILSLSLSPISSVLYFVLFGGHSMLRDTLSCGLGWNLKLPHKKQSKGLSTLLSLYCNKGLWSPMVTYPALLGVQEVWHL